MNKLVEKYIKTMNNKWTKCKQTKTYILNILKNA